MTEATKVVSTETKVTVAPITAQDIIEKLAVDHVKGNKINIYEVLEFADWEEHHPELVKVRDWLLGQRVCQKREWAEACKRKRTTKDLGCYPQTPREYVELFVKKHKIGATFKKTLSRHRTPKVMGYQVAPGQQISDQGLVNLVNARKRDEITMLDFHRELRNEAFELGLPFPNRAIEDAADMWFNETYPLRRDEIYLEIQYRKGLATGPEGRAAWDKIIDASFDLERHDKTFVEACIRKFIWQTKRKMVSLPVYNHLMLVIVGAQGKGKTQFVKKLLNPVSEVTANTDFRAITDNRNIDIWRNYVLFMDEMSSSSKSDMDVVKNLITADTLTLRPMRTNDQIVVRQNATFIGCANKELSQMIKDETGIRRFVALNFSNTPNWKACNETQWELLWQSVDENGDDPMEGMMPQLRQLQEESRSRGPVETWIESRKACYEWKFIPQLFDEFRMWADLYYPNSYRDVEWFKGEFRRIQRDTDQFDAERCGPKGYKYRDRKVEKSETTDEKSA